MTEHYCFYAICVCSIYGATWMLLLPKMLRSYLLYASTLIISDPLFWTYHVYSYIWHHVSQKNILNSIISFRSIGHGIYTLATHFYACTVHPMSKLNGFVAFEWCDSFIIIFAYCVSIMYAKIHVKMSPVYLIYGLTGVAGRFIFQRFNVCNVVATNETACQRRSLSPSALLSNENEDPPCFAGLGGSVCLYVP